MSETRAVCPDSRTLAISGSASSASSFQHDASVAAGTTFAPDGTRSACVGGFAWSAAPIDATSATHPNRSTRLRDATIAPRNGKVTDT